MKQVLARTIDGVAETLRDSFGGIHINGATKRGTNCHRFVARASPRQARNSCDSPRPMTLASGGVAAMRESAIVLTKCLAALPTGYYCSAVSTTRRGHGDRP
jgi:hypothetical protein